MDRSPAAKTPPSIKLPPLIIAMVLAGCATTPPVVMAPIPPPGPGMERVIGHDVANAIALLGKPGLDRSEGPGRVLQFARSGCILDVYYYPDAPAPSARSADVGPPLARYAEARTLDGKSQDAGKCVAAMLTPVR